MPFLHSTPILSRLIPISQAEIDAPTAAQLADYSAMYMLEEAPYTKYHSDGVSLVPFGATIYATSAEFSALVSASELVPGSIYNVDGDLRIALTSSTWVYIASIVKMYTAAQLVTMTGAGTLAPFTIYAASDTGELTWAPDDSTLVSLGTIPNFTAAQLTALAAAGGLTPYAQYVPSDTGAVLRAMTASSLVAEGQRRKKIAFFGTSITQSAGQVQLYGYRISTTVNGFTSSYWAILWADPETPSGVGTWSYDATAKTATWAAFGESAGVAVDVSRSGVFYLTSSVAGHGLTIVWDGTGTTYGTGSTTVTVPANGNQYQAIWSPRSYVACALMQAGASWRIATTSVYPFGIACGGTPGLNATVLANSIWQTSQIVADVDVIETGTNDINGGRTAAQIIADLTTIIKARQAAGTPNIGVLTIPPRTGYSAGQLRIRNQVNKWIRDYCAANVGMRCLDVAAAITDPATGVWVTNYSADNVHPAPLGAWAMGRVISAWLLSLEADTPYWPDYNDTYDATTNPYAALQAAAGYTAFTGTGGTAGAGASGVVPANYTLQRQSGTISAVGSQPARTDGIAGNWYQIVITGGGANEYMRLEPQSNPLTLSTYGIAAGDQIEGYLEVNISASVGLKVIDMLLTWGGLSGRYIDAFTDQLGGNLALTDSPGKFWLRLPPATVPVGATTVSILFRAGADTSATVQFGRWTVNKVRPV
jgi:hypothetical protein